MSLTLGQAAWTPVAVDIGWGVSPSQLSQVLWALQMLQMSAIHGICEEQSLPGERKRKNGFLPLGFPHVLFWLRQDLAV